MRTRRSENNIPVDDRDEDEGKEEFYTLEKGKLIGLRRERKHTISVGSVSEGTNPHKYDGEIDNDDVYHGEPQGIILTSFQSAPALPLLSHVTVPLNMIWSTSSCGVQ